MTFYIDLPTEKLIQITLKMCMTGSFIKVWQLLSDSHNLSLTWNVDGFPLCKSSKLSILYFVVNELPFKLRMLMENVILGGLRFGETKLNMSTFLKPIFTELRNLERVGVQVQSLLEPLAFMTKVVLLAGTCDLPAKCLVLSTIWFNGKYGCSKCLQPGITYHTSAHGHTHIYPFCSAAPDGPKHNDTMQMQGVFFQMGQLLRNQGTIMLMILSSIIS